MVHPNIEQRSIMEQKRQLAQTQQGFREIQDLNSTFGTKKNSHQSQTKPEFAMTLEDLIVQGGAPATKVNSLHSYAIASNVDKFYRET